MKTNPSIKRKGLAGFLALAFITLLYPSCKKPQLEETPKPSKTVNGQVPVTINLEEVYARLPQTVMYNLAGDVHLNLAEAQWRYEQEYVMVRIPLNNAVDRSYLYAVKPYNAPLGPVRSFLVQFLPEDGSTASDFSGKQMWLNLQDGQVYGVSYVHNTATSFLTSEPTYQYWELSMLNAGLFYFDGNDKIGVYPDPTNPDPIWVPDPRGNYEPTMLYQKGLAHGLFAKMLNGLGGIFKAVGGLFKDGGSGGSGGPGAWGPGGGGMYGGGDNPNNPPGSGGPIGGSGYENPPSPPPPPFNIWDNAIGSTTWASLGETNGTSSPLYINGVSMENVVAGGQQVYNIVNPTISYLQSVLGLNQAQSDWLTLNIDKANRMKNFILVYEPNLTQQQKKDAVREHILLMMNDPSYFSFVTNYEQNNAGMWWINETWLDNPANDFQLYPQQNYQQSQSLNAAEKALVALYPGAAYVIHHNVPIAFTYSQNTGLPQPHNGKQDAFRHAFFQAINTRDVMPRFPITASMIVRMFSDAHESDVPPSQELEKTMDLFNNEIGINYCWNCVSGVTSSNSIRDAILTRLNNGELRYLKPLDANDNIIQGTTVILPTNQ